MASRAINRFNIIACASASSPRAAEQLESTDAPSQDVM